MNDIDINIENRIKKPVTFVLLSVCTCKRPNMLKDCILSVNKLIIPQNIKIELLIIDNDSDGSARNTIEQLKNNIKIPVHYFVEDKRGISNARNRLLKEAINLKASHILMFDDDELLTENTLYEHINLYTKNEKALITTGPTISKFKPEYPEYIKKHMVFKQSTTKKTGDIRSNCAAGNVFFPVNLLTDYGLCFSEKYVFMGGEDGDFFHKAFELGFTIVWNSEAIIYEAVPPARATINYILKKCYYNGYAGSYYKFKNNKNNNKKMFYISKTVLVLILNAVCILPSILFSLTAFWNVLGTLIRTQGKIDGVIKNEPLNFYENIYGD